MIAHGLLHDTFESAITWDRFGDFHATVKAATEAAITRATGAPGHVSCRFTHVYPDGPAPYFTYHAKPTPGAEIEQWRAIKAAASDALIAAGGTITHHHAVGRDHMPWYEAQRPALFGAAPRGRQTGARPERHPQSRRPPAAAAPGAATDGREPPGVGLNLLPFRRRGCLSRCLAAGAREAGDDRFGRDRA